MFTLWTKNALSVDGLKLKERPSSSTNRVIMIYLYLKDEVFASFKKDSKYGYLLFGDTIYGINEL